ncbi:PH domain-containing protein [Candidatus Berkiella aquae]|uniref:Bacterial membrane flanked domain protein n=1 Tax=Candidatus Berkiella aquae TaxID=295108 RepID=A0A0Q9YHZ6_9GAMM|nr:PH domain-containing protein [Candidatus Berkiella aquae]MCS5712773.1 PH domain-containing protein [Candidatus Berkiella aquae]
MSTVIHPVFFSSLRIIRMASWMLFLPFPLMLFILTSAPAGNKFSSVFIILSAIFIFIGVIWYVLSKRIYKASSFELGEDSVGEREQFLGNYFKEIKYHDIKEIAIGQGPFQQKYGLGNIFIRSYASSPGANVNTGITLFDIKDAKEIYETIQRKRAKS